MSAIVSAQRAALLFLDEIPPRRTFRIGFFNRLRQILSFAENGVPAAKFRAAARLRGGPGSRTPKALDRRRHFQ
ncbi:hypothetical protein [Novosphingobium sp. RL4]|uniref:hypothetical protein n=1 Tax=Novosphingobium sp. RL4 TaxID=3109595 RepID=UPI002D798B8E|nr:hypothetical protein [Novosphingobium sp. RL4]WRT95145.1 hypothetical protein U9J33_23395 [Novosphingobium sp. RL4]